MHLSLSAKLFITSLMLAVAAVALVAALTWWSLGSGFVVYVAQAQLDRMDRLADELVAAGSERGLQWLADDRQAWEEILLRGLQPEPREHKAHDSDDREPQFDRSERLPPPPPPPPTALDGDEDRAEAGEDKHWLEERRRHLPPPLARLASRMALLGPDGGLIAGPPSAVDSEARRPITVGDRLLGWVVLKPSKHFAKGVHSRFVEAQARNLVIIGLGTVLLAGLAALLLGRHLSRPITAMAETTRQLREGDYQARAKAANRSDELGSLARDINGLAATLAAAEAGRKRWVQDTAHELRTPLSSLRAEVEALQDGINQPDEASLARLHAGIMTLAALIEDLRQLSEADGGRLNLDLHRGHLWPFVQQVAETLESRAKAANLEILLTDRSGGQDLAIFDPHRLGQVLSNLMVNALTYSEPGGRLEILLSHDRKRRCLVLQFDDTPPGVPESELPHIFDRFYRVEASRSRRTGGRGLGLAICRAIVEAHGGQIGAEASPLGGLRILLTLPLAGSEESRA